jgi:hypothetical protein
MAEMVSAERSSKKVYKTLDHKGPGNRIPSARGARKGKQKQSESVHYHLFTSTWRKAQNTSQGELALLSSEQLNVHLVLVSRVLFQDNAALEDVSVWDPLLCGQLCTFRCTQPYR